MDVSLNERMELQSAEFKAVANVVQSFRALPAVVDDDYPEARHRYESDVKGLVRALQANNRVSTQAISQQFIDANRSRALRWHHGNLGNWSAAEWGNAIAGEVGEFCNIAKKILRHEKGMQQNAVNSMAVDGEIKRKLHDSAADELADVVTYCVVTACAMGIDIDAAVRRKFNEISERENFPERV